MMIKKIKPKNNNIGIVIHKQSWFFHLFENTIPYLPFIFKNKRERVKARNYFRYKHMRKAQEIYTKSLIKNVCKPVDWKNIDIELPEYWEITKN